MGDLPSGRPSHQGPATSSSKVSGPPAALVRSRTEVRDRLRLLSWSSSKTAPPPTSPCASTPRLPEGPGLPHPGHVPLVSFFPTSAAFSAHGFAGLLHPAAGHGVRPVSSRRPTLKPTTDPPPRRPFPFEALPPNWPVPVTRSLSSAPLEERPAEAFRLPRPRGVVSSPEFHHSAFPPVHELPWGSLDPGFHLDPPSPAGPAGLPEENSCPVPL